MPCYHPMQGWYARHKNASGRRSVVFDVKEGLPYRSLQVPCGKCVGCRLEYSRQWAVRILHESKLYDANSFVTLTYADLPPNGSLRPEDFTKFMKRFRMRFGDVRYFQCGEYGEQLQRPHHHAILFGRWFDDARFLKERDGVKLYRSDALDEVWSHGACSFGEVTFESAAYVARYTVKKLSGRPPDGKVPEYATMSRRPGIGRAHVDLYGRDIYPADEVVVRGVPCRPPRYYDKLLESRAPTVLARIKGRRRRVADEAEAKLYSEGVSPLSKLSVREVVKRAALSTLVREFEDGSA